MIHVTNLLEKSASEEAHKFLDWFEKANGFVPYGFHGDVKRLLILFAINLESTQQKETT